MSNPSDPITVRESDPCASTKGRRAKRLEMELAQVAAMHEAVQDQLVDSSRRAYWCQMWEFEVLKAADNERFNREQFKWLRSTALVSALLVTTLAGISISVTGPWSTLIRVTTLVLGLVSAISAGMTAVLRPGERWLVYRRLGSDLKTAAWKFINNSAQVDGWTMFVEETNEAMRNYDQAYQSVLIVDSLGEGHKEDGGGAAT